MTRGSRVLAALLLPPAPEAGVGVGADEMPARGDLPPEGDGAPNNDVGASG